MDAQVVHQNCQRHTHADLSACVCACIGYTLPASLFSNNNASTGQSVPLAMETHHGPRR